jgi:hypothetical protein
MNAAQVNSSSLTNVGQVDESITTNAAQVCSSSLTNAGQAGESERQQFKLAKAFSWQRRQLMSVALAEAAQVSGKQRK